jgi:opacity protein-like surface antigen
MFAPGWSAFIEYDYVDLGNRTITATDASTLLAATATARQDIHMVKAGVNFRLPPPR